MNLLNSLIISFIVTIVIAAITLPWVLKLCHKHGVYDTPNARKVHMSSIPRLGGSVFAPTSALGLIAGMTYLVESSELTNSIHIHTLLIGAGLLVIYIIGLLDDIFGLSANLKFIIQFFAALAFPIVNLYIDNLYNLFGITTMPVFVCYAVTVVVVMFIINAMNTIDGIDGLCACITSIALAVYCYFFYRIHNYIFCLLACSMLGSLLVFLRYNLFGNARKGTKTFMGDSGSLMLGFTLSYMGIKLSMSNTRIAPPEEGILIPYTVLFIPMADLARVAICRILRGQHPFSPDKTHIHHLLLGIGMTQHKALITLLMADILLICLNFNLWHCEVGLTWIFVLNVILFTAFVEVLIHKKANISLTNSEIETESTVPKKPLIEKSRRRKKHKGNNTIHHKNKHQ